jgi:hypothetical protein
VQAGGLTVTVTQAGGALDGEKDIEVKRGARVDCRQRHLQA